ncbi:hypothetical protein ACSBR1_028162 [Camellia fascicularis]
MKKIDTNSSASVVGPHDGEMLSFSLQSILAATDNFSEAKKLGEVGLDLFISSDFHFSITDCDNFSLDPSKQANLDWSNLFQVIEGIGQGLICCHKYSRLKVIHRDLKASNILLDEALNPKISDFGTARSFRINQTDANTRRVVGTYSYMSPKYALYGQFYEKSDVFSFGVLLLEIVSGKRSTNSHQTEHSLTLIGWAWENWKEGSCLELIDPSIRDICNLQEALKCIVVGLLCVQEFSGDRPTMYASILMLRNENASVPSPKAPAFSTYTNSNMPAILPKHLVAISTMK